MCVTNITVRRTQPIILPNQLKVAPASCSGLTARLIGTFELKAPEQNVPARNVPSVPQHQQAANGIASPFGALGEPEKPRRRRQPQKPGKTAKQNDRHFVVHNYRDHAHEEEEDPESAEAIASRASFPYKIHAILEHVERNGLTDVISWQPHGRCFIIHKPKEFVETLMPDYFGPTKFTSFQRQLNLYGFSRLTRGPDAGGYYHELFLRGKAFLVKRMTRTKVKGTKYKAASSPDQEPNFYRMEPVVVSPSTSPTNSPKSATSSGSPLRAPQMFSLNPPVNTMSPYPIPFSGAVNLNVGAEPTAIPASDNEADDVLDQAVEEIFDEESDEIIDMNGFADSWSPITAMNNDRGLGFALDLLLDSM